MSAKGSVHSVGNMIGVGKESDVYIVSDENDVSCVMKLHRLGRTSFRKVKEKRHEGIEKEREERIRKMVEGDKKRNDELDKLIRGNKAH